MRGGGSGKVSRWTYRASITRLGAACRRLLEQDGSKRQAVCHQRYMEDRRRRSPVGISRMLSGSISQYHAQGGGVREIGRQMGRFTSSCCLAVRGGIAAVQQEIHAQGWQNQQGHLSFRSMLSTDPRLAQNAAQGRQPHRFWHGAARPPPHADRRQNAKTASPALSSAAWACRSTPFSATEST